MGRNRAAEGYQEIRICERRAVAVCSLSTLRCPPSPPDTSQPCPSPISGALLTGKFGSALRARQRALDQRAADLLAAASASSSPTHHQNPASASAVIVDPKTAWLTSWEGTASTREAAAPGVTAGLAPGLLSVPDLLSNWAELSADVLSEGEARKALSLALVWRGGGLPHSGGGWRAGWNSCSQ